MLVTVPTTRDPVSVLFDRGAVDLLDRVYAAGRGKWVGTRLGDPGPETRLWLASMGIDWRGPDAPATPSRTGGLDCRDRWTRAFIRAVYYNHRLLSGDALKADIGRRLPPLGIFPSGRAVRLQLLQGGRAARRAAAKRPDADRIFNINGEAAGGRASSIEYRDW